MVAKIQTLVVRGIKMRTEEDKVLILQAFCNRFDVSEMEGKQILEKAQWQPFIAQSMLTQKTKTEQPKKPERKPSEEHPFKTKKEPSSKELAKALLKKLHQRDNFDSQHKFASSTQLLETALNQFPNSPEIQRQIYKLLDQPKNTPIPHKKRKPRLF